MTITVTLPATYECPVYRVEVTGGKKTTHDYGKITVDLAALLKDQTPEQIGLRLLHLTHVGAIRDGIAGIKTDYIEDCNAAREAGKEPEPMADYWAKYLGGVWANKLADRPIGAVRAVLSPVEREFIVLCRAIDGLTIPKDTEKTYAAIYAAWHKAASAKGMADEILAEAQDTVKRDQEKAARLAARMAAMDAAKDE